MQEKASGRSIEGFFLAAASIAIVAFSFFYFIRIEWLPPLASDREGLDRLYFAILVATGIALVVVKLFYAFFVWYFSDLRRARASYWHHSVSLEITWTVVTTVILTGFIIVGMRLWSNVYSAPPPDALLVEVTGEQFMWNTRYAGKDGIFGRTDPKLVTTDNHLGLDKNDPASKDDITLLNQMFLPLDRPVRIRLRSKDVLHSFFLPNFRVKQDAVPGMNIEFWFVPKKLGEYEIACSELCGLGHYRMRGILNVVSPGDFEKWLETQNAELAKP